MPRARWEKAVLCALVSLAFGTPGLSAIAAPTWLRCTLSEIAPPSGELRQAPYRAQSPNTRFFVVDEGARHADEYFNGNLSACDHFNVFQNGNAFSMDCGSGNQVINRITGDIMVGHCPNGVVNLRTCSVEHGVCELTTPQTVTPRKF